MADARFQRDDREARIRRMFELDSILNSVILFGGILDARVRVARQFPWLVVVKEFDNEFSLAANPRKRRKLQMLREMRER